MINTPFGTIGEYRDIVGQFSYVVETERRFYLANGVDVQVRNSDGELMAMSRNMTVAVVDAS